MQAIEVNQMDTEPLLNYTKMMISCRTGKLILSGQEVPPPTSSAVPSYTRTAQEDFVQA